MNGTQGSQTEKAIEILAPQFPNLHQPFMLRADAQPINAPGVDTVLIELSPLFENQGAKNQPLSNS